MIGSFFVGSLWTRVNYLQKEGNPDSSPAENEQKTPLVEQAKILGVQDFAKITQGGAAVKGDENAPVVIVEFSEYLCPFCGEYVGVDIIPTHPIDEGKTYQKIMDNFVATGKVRYIFRDFPVHGEPAARRAVAARCAGEQGKYWQYHDLLFEKQNEEVEESQENTIFTQWAVSLGLNGEEFASCLQKEEHRSQVAADYNLGMEIARAAWDAGLIDKSRVPQREMASLGTPTFFINGHQVIGAQSYEVFEKIIEEELKK